MKGGERGGKETVSIMLQGLCFQLGWIFCPSKTRLARSLCICNGNNVLAK